MFQNAFSPEQMKFAREVGIDDDRTLSEILRRELNSTDSGHLRSVLRLLIMSHVAANERIRELEQNLAALSRKTSGGRS